MKHKLHVTFATRDDMVRKAVESVRDIGNIHVWADGRASPDISGVEHHSPGLVGIVPMMNMCIKTSWADDVMFWMHDDAEALPGVAKQFREYVEGRLHKHWGLIFTNGDKLCAFNMRAVREVGWWDTMFFQYEADIDYHYRLRLAGWPPEFSPFGGGVIHAAAQTGSADRQHGGDPNYMKRIQFIDGCQFQYHYYEFKWGGKRGEERFSVPFQDNKALARYQTIFKDHQTAREATLAKTIRLPRHRMRSSGALKA